VAPVTDIQANDYSRQGDHSTPLANLRRLWGAVLLTNVSDMLETLEDWPMEDFEAVCEYADTDPDKVLRIVQHLHHRGLRFRYTAAMRLRQEAST